MIGALRKFLEWYKRGLERRTSKIAWLFLAVWTIFSLQAFVENSLFWCGIYILFGIENLYCITRKRR